jgi:hypothetical protein
MPIVQVIITIVIIMVISAVIGAVAKALNNLNEMQANRRAEEERRARSERAERAAERARAAQDERAERPKATPAAATATADTANSGAVRPAGSDMDRFLAEIDRLRRKQAANPDPPAAQPGSAAPVAPVVQPVKPPASERPRPRVVAELADPPAAPAGPSGGSFGTSPQAPTRTAPVAGQVEELPVATVLKPTSSTGAPATKVTVFTKRPRPAAKTNLGKNLTALLGSGQGVAMAVVLQEILGPPKSQQKK